MAPPLEMEPYLWIVIVAGIFGFAYAFGIGANDVANAFASTVASKSLTLGQAVFVASIFEFGGAFFLGAAVTKTVRNSIFDSKLYVGQEEIVLLGMFTSLIVATFMLFVATYLAMPVSTTHTIVGCIMGFSIAAKGFKSINATVATQIFISWLISPLVAGLIALGVFSMIKYFILHHENAYARAYYSFPLILTIFIGIDVFYILYKGLNNMSFQDDLKIEWTLPLSFGIGAFCGFIWLVIVGPIAKRRVEEKFARDAHNAEMKALKEADAIEKAEKTAAGGDDEEYGDVDKNGDDKPEAAAPIVEEIADAEATQPEKMGFKERMASVHSTFVANTYGQDLHEQSMQEDTTAEQMWSEAEVFDAPSEQMYTYVQVFTACLNSFAHGANDIANAIAPLSAIFLIYNTGELNSKAPVQKWVLAYGGAGLVLGLLIYGYKVMKSIGYKLVALSPTRGASAELSASLFVVTASFLEIPVSSTQAIVGAVTGVGLSAGFKSVSWWFFAKVCMGWVFIFFTAVILSAGFFAFIAFAPSIDLS